MQHILMENKQLIDRFCQDFNKNIVCGKFEQTFVMPSESILQKIFVVLNEFVFDSKLPNIPIFCLPKNVFKTMLKSAYDVDESALKKATSSYAMYVNKPNEVDDKLISGKECIVFNTSFGKEPFGFIVNCLCHEMIHCYDMHFGDCLEHHMRNEEFEAHSTVTFLKLMKKAKDQWDIPITIHGNNNPSNKLYKSAQEFFTRDYLGENDDTIHKTYLINDHTIVKRLSKKSLVIIELD